MTPVNPTLGVNPSLFNLKREKEMKKLIFPVLALVAALTVSCNKEQGTESPAAKASQKVTIEASIAGTKTAYANDKTFSWLAGDKISVMEDLDGTVKFNEFTAASEGPTTTFDGEISDGATLGKWAVYPSTLEPEVSEDGTLTIRVQHGSVQEIDPANPLQYLPLVGQKQEDDSYKFATAMGAVKFSFKNVPDNVAYFNIQANEPVWGYFTADEDGTVKLANFVSGDEEPGYTWWDVVPAEDGTLDVYVSMPVGTLTAGMTVWLEDAQVNEIYAINTVKDIEVVRNRVTELAPVEIPSSGMTLEDVYGVYEVETVDFFADEETGEYNVGSRYLVIEPSDNEDYGNVMFTTSFLGMPVQNMYASFNDVNGELNVAPQYIYQDEAGEYAEYFSYLVLATVLGTEDNPSLELADMVLQFDEPGVFHLSSEGAPMIAADIFEENWGYYGCYSDLNGTRIMTLDEFYNSGEASAAPKTKAARNFTMPIRSNNSSMAKASDVKIPFRATKHIAK